MKTLLFYFFGAFTVFTIHAQKAYEGFDYEFGDEVGNVSAADEANGWSSGWSVANIDAVVSDGVAAVDYFGKDKGNALEISNGASDFSGAAFRELAGDWPDETGKVYWVSVLEELVSDFYSSNYSGLHICAKSGHKIYLGLPWSNSDQGKWWVVVNDQEGGASVNELIDVQKDIPVWFVAKIVMSGDDDMDSVYVWLNPDASQDDLNVKDAIYTTGNQNFNQGLEKVGINGYTGFVTRYDEIALGTSFQDVNVFANLSGVKSNTLEQVALKNYPNPFSSETTISYSLKENQLAKITVCNMLGEEVDVLLNEDQSAGSHEISYSAECLSDGLYLCKLQAGNEISVIQMMVKK